MNQYQKFLSAVFSDTAKFMAAKELNKMLAENFGITQDYARKVVQRAVDKNIISCSTPLTFGQGQYIYFSQKAILTWDGILPVVETSRPPLYRLMISISNNGGILSYYEGMKITASPIDQHKTKVSTLDDLIALLGKLNFISIYTDSNYVKYIVRLKQGDHDLSAVETLALIENHFVSMRMDTVFLPDILRWLNNSNIISRAEIVYRNSRRPSLGAIHNNLLWDAFAYTKTTGLNTVGNKGYTQDEKNTLIVLDVVISRPYMKYDLDGFYSRVQIVLNSVKTGSRKVLPIIFFQEASDEVINFMNALGFMHFNLGSVYGEKIYDLLLRLKLVNTELYSNVNNTEELLSSIETSLSTIKDSGQELNLQNIKGDLFESLMYPLILCIYPGSDIVPGRTLKLVEKPENKKEQYEYDYIVLSSGLQEIVIFELKGFKSSSTIKLGNSDSKNTVHWFFKRTLPFAKKYYQKQMDSRVVRGCYLTSAKYEPDALTFLNTLNKSKLKPSQLDVYYDGQALLQLLTARGLIKIKQVVERYYFSDME